MIDKNSHIPIYAQLEGILLEMIESGELKPGDMIPSENELSKKYGISRMTAKKAIDSLTIKGLVERTQGKGTYVSSYEKKIELPLNRLRGFTQKVCEMGLVPENKLLAFEKIPCPKNISKILGISYSFKYSDVLTISHINRSGFSISIIFLISSFTSLL